MDFTLLLCVADVVVVGGGGSTADGILTPQNVWQWWVMTWQFSLRLWLCDPMCKHTHSHRNSCRRLEPAIHSRSTAAAHRNMWPTFSSFLNFVRFFVLFYLFSILKIHLKHFQHLIGALFLLPRAIRTLDAHCEQKQNGLSIHSERLCTCPLHRMQVDIVPIRCNCSIVRRSAVAPMRRSLAPSFSLSLSL